VDLPQPDSPTTERISPCTISRETSFKALTVVVVRVGMAPEKLIRSRKPPEMSKCFTTLLMRTRDLLSVMVYLVCE
jgi:hypothetical protein